MTVTTTADLIGEARTFIPGGVNSAGRALGRPYGFRSAEGAYLTDFDGRRYVDYHAAFGAILLGHSDPRVNQAVAETFGIIDLAGFGTSELEVECARLVAQLFPLVEMSVTTMSGTEATFQAVRLARGVTEPQVHRQVPGLLPRLARRGRPQRRVPGGQDLPARPAVGRHPRRRA